MVYVLKNNFGRYYKRMNRFNVSESAEIGFAKTFKYKHQADFVNNELKEDFKVIGLTEEKYIELYNTWYDLKYTYQEDKNEICVAIK